MLVVLAGAEGIVSADTTDAGFGPGEPTTIGGYTVAGAVWFAWTAPYTGKYGFKITHGTIGDLLWEVYEASDFGGSWPTPIASFDPDEGVFDVTEGVEYLIRVGGYLTNEGTFSIGWADRSWFALAPQVTAQSGTIEVPWGSLISINETGEPNAYGSYTYYCSMWHKFVCTTSGTVTFDTSNGQFHDMGMSVYTGTWGSLTKVAEDDSSGGSGHAKITGLSVSAGTTYYVQTAHYGAAPTGNPSTLAWTASGDLFAVDGGDTVVAIGQALDVETAPTFAKLKTLDLALAAEAEAVEALLAAKSTPLLQATELETVPGGWGPLKGAPLGQAAELESGGALAGSKTKPIGQVSDVENVGTMTMGMRFVALLQAVEVAAASALGRRKTKTLGEASEADEVGALGKIKFKAVAKTTEVDAANLFGRRKSRQAGQAVDLEDAVAIDAAKSYPLGKVTDVESAQRLKLPGFLSVRLLFGGASRRVLALRARRRVDTDETARR